MNDPHITEFARIPFDDTLNYFYSHDLGCCAALVASGFNIVSMDKHVNGRVQFVIKRNSGIDGALEAYWNGSLMVDARTYFDSLKMLKTRLYSL